MGNVESNSTVTAEGANAPPQPVSPIKPTSILVPQTTPTKISTSAKSNDIKGLENSERKATKPLSLESPNKKVTVADSPSKPPLTPTSQEARILNLSLENILQVTLRIEAADGMTTFLGDMLDCRGELLSTNNVSEVVCAKLDSKSDILNAISYLVGSYKRLCIKEAASAGNVRADLAR